MSTWGSYFASYVKKSDAPATTATVGVKEAKVDLNNEEPFELVVKDVTPVAKAIPKTTTTTATTAVTTNPDTFKRSNSASKKLYEIPTEFPKQIPERSTSNAARVAKLFGYAATTSNPTPPKSKLGSLVEQAVGLEKERGEAKKSGIVASSVFASRGSTASDETVDSQSSEIVIGLPPDLVASGSVVEKKITPPWEVKLEPLVLKSLDQIQKPKEQDAKLVTPESTRVVPPPAFKSETNLIPNLLKADSDRIEMRDSKFSIEEETSSSRLSIEKELGSLTNIKLELLEVKSPKHSIQTTTPELKDDIQAMLESFASQAPSELISNSDPVPTPIGPPKAAEAKLKALKLSENKSKDVTLGMLELFASQAASLDKKEDLSSKVPTTPAAGLKVGDKKRVVSSSRRKESLGMLDFFASQAGTGTTDMIEESTTPTNNKMKPLMLPIIVAQTPLATENKTSPTNVQKALPSSSRRNKSLELLDFFASQAMSTISEDQPLSQPEKLKTAPLATLPENETLPVAPPLQLKTPTEPETVKPLSRWNFAMPRIQQKVKTDRLEQVLVPAPAAKIMEDIQTETRQQTLNVPNTPKPKVTSPGHKRSATSIRISQPRTPTRLVRSNTTPSKPTFDRPRSLDSQDDQEEEMAIDFRERFLEYEKQAEQIRLEKEQMEAEHERMLAEMNMFQAEADRIAEEEAAMKKFVESLEEERLRDEENEMRKQREKEAKLEAERLERERIENERLEQERLAREEKERIREEEEARIKALEDERLKILALQEERIRLERMQAEQALQQAAEKARKDQEMKEAKERAIIEENARRERENEEARRRKQEARLEEERLALEEVERLNADMRRYAEQADADRRLMEEELEREAAERREQERIEEELEDERLERERILYEEEQERLELEREANERTARLQRRKAREELERLEYEKEAAEEEARYYEQERQREEEMRAAADQRRRADAQRQRRDDAYYAEQERIAAARTRQRPVVVEDSESEDEIVKAERKIKEAFAGLAKERGQAGSGAVAPMQGGSGMRRANTSQKPDRGPMIRKQEADIRVARNNTVGARPVEPRRDQAAMTRENTTRGRPIIKGGLPSGPRRRQ